MLARPMPLITLADAELAYGLHPLLDRAALAVRSGERIGLIGRNGTGKSTLLKVIAGELPPDGGEIHRQQGLKVALVSQEVPLELTGRVFDIVAAGLGEAADILDGGDEVHHLMAFAPAREQPAALFAGFEDEDGHGPADE